MGNAAYRIRLAKVQGNDKVVSIDDCAFENWTSLKRITVPRKITTLGDGVFSECPSLTSITFTLPTKISSLGHEVFINCSSLTSVALPSTITVLGDSVFQGCTSLTSVTLPLMITSLGDRFFYNCSSLSSVALPQITTVGDSCFYGCSSLISITVPSTVTSFGYGVFQGCSSLRSVTLPLTITSLEAGLFWDCSALKSITLPPNINTIDSHIFCRCVSLTTVNIRGNITSISSRAFEGCSRLTIIKAPSFSTTTFDEDRGELKELLVEAGYSKGNPDDFLHDQPTQQDCHMYYDRKAWARTNGEYYCLPLCTAAARSLKWEDMRHIFAANMPAIYKVDWLTGLPLFMLAAVGPCSDMESIYNLLKQYPLAIGTMEKRSHGVDKSVQDRNGMTLRSQPSKDKHSYQFYQELLENDMYG